MIEVFDNIIPNKVLDFYESIISGKTLNTYFRPGNCPSFPFTFNNSITEDTKEERNDPSQFKFHHQLCNWDLGDGFLTPHSVYSTIFFQPLYYLCNHCNFFLEEIFRGILFLHPPSIDPKVLTPHVDFLTPHFVCLFYINDSDGDTVFFNEQKEEIKRVSPKKGRMVVFNGDILHAGSTPSKNVRMFINYNFRFTPINDLMHYST
jgi:hypothetical protein